MNMFRILMLGTLFSTLFTLPSFIVQNASLSAEQAIRGRNIKVDESDGTFEGIYGGSGSGRGQYSNCLLVYGGRWVTGDIGFVKLDELSLNQALPDPPDVNLNISQSSDSKKALVRWNID